MIDGKDSRYKCFWIANELGTGGVKSFIVRGIDKVFHVKRVSDRLMIIRMVVGEFVVTELSVYAPQTGLTIAEKELFYDSLQNLAQTINDLETPLFCGDLNGPIVKAASSYEGVYGGYGFGKRNIDGERILKFAVSNNLVVGNSTFVKKDNYPIMYQPGGCSSQVDYILLQCKKFLLVKDIKVIAGEECIAQHRVPICDLKLKIRKNTKKKFVPKLRTWKLKDPSMKEADIEFLNDRLVNYRIDNPDNVDDIWKYFNPLMHNIPKWSGTL